MFLIQELGEITRGRKTHGLTHFSLPRALIVEA